MVQICENRHLKPTLDNFNIKRWNIVDRKYPPWRGTYDLTKHFQEQVEDCGCNNATRTYIKHMYYCTAELVGRELSKGQSVNKTTEWKRKIYKINTVK